MWKANNAGVNNDMQFSDDGRAVRYTIECNGRDGGCDTGRTCSGDGRGGGRFGLGRRNVCRDIIILAIDMGTGVS